MTRDEAKQKISIEAKETYPYNIIDNVDDVIDKIFDEHEAQLKAKNERIKELEEAMKPKTCEGCKFRNTVKFVQVESETLECCSVCVRNCYDYYEPKDNE